MEDFKIGDVVTVKSGGPKMAIKTINADTVVCSYWNVSKQQFFNRNFVKSQLNLIRED